MKFLFWAGNIRPEYLQPGTDLQPWAQSWAQRAKSADERGRTIVAVEVPKEDELLFVIELENELQKRYRATMDPIDELLFAGFTFTSELVREARE